MNHEDVRLRGTLGLLRVGQNLDLGLGAINDRLDRPAVKPGPRPEIAGDGGEIAVAEEWMKMPQITIVRVGRDSSETS